MGAALAAAFQDRACWSSADSTMPPDPGRLRFADFVLDVDTRTLSSRDTRLRLQEQPFRILQMLLERPGRVVTRDELRAALWPSGTFVDFEHSLNAAIKRLRAALGDNAETPLYIETVPRRGYRLKNTPHE